MTILTAKNTPRVSYTATSNQTAFTIPFEFFSTNDIKVYNGTSLLTYNASPSSTSQYSVTGTASASDSAFEFGAGGTITLGSTGASNGDIITIIRDISIERTSDFPTTGSFDITSLNTDLDKVYAKLADIDQQSDRSVKLLDTDSIAATVTLPAKATRASKVLTFDSDGDVQTTIAATDVTTIAGISSDVTTVSGIASNVTSVVSNASNINTVAGAISNVNTVAGISSNVTSVAGVASLITSDFVSDLNTLATSDIISDLNLVATSDFVSDLNSLATSDFVSDLNALEAIKANVNTVATNISSVNSFASQYRTGSSDPTDSLDEGDLFYNSTNNVLKYYDGSGWESITAGGITSVAADSTPQLGGDLDMNGQDIVTTSNADIELAPHGTGHVTVKGNTNQGAIQFNCENNTHGQQIKAAPHSESASNILTIPSTGGNSTLVSDASTSTLTNKSLTAPILTGSSSAAGSILFKEDTDNGTNAVTLIGPASTADVTLTLPAAADTLVGKATTDTLTNKTISGSSNTLSNIANSSLTNSAITLNGSSVSLGGSATISAGTDWQAVKTSAYTASAGEGVFANTSASAWTLTLPSSPSIGDEVSFKDYASTFHTYNLTIGRNSKPIEGVAEDLVISVKGAGNTLVFTDDTKGWLIKTK